MANVTEMLLRWSDGDEEALDELVPIVYQELKRLAHARLRREDTGLTLNTTGLVHEAYLKLVDIKRVQWKDHHHFLAMASRAMRRILIEQARKRAAAKRGGGNALAPSYAEDSLVSDDHADKLVQLNKALETLAGEHPRPCKVVELLYFGGLTQEEVGNVLDISQPTVARDLRFARAWLSRAWTSD